ncbi:MAG: UDP-glucose dehydrogenase family protein [Dehalococcoidia bacterium]
MRDDKVCVIGIWHLGAVTSACLADLGYSVVGVDRDPQKVRALNQGLPPLFEPGLEELIARNIASQRLRYTTDLSEALRGSRRVLITHDTPVDEEDEIDLTEIEAGATRAAPHLEGGALVIVSSQVPLGTCERLEAIIRRGNPSLKFAIAYVPENLKLGQGIQHFLNPDMIVIGADDPASQDQVDELFAPIGGPRVKMGLRSAEMTKHAINAFVATSISFANEVANLCDELGTDAQSVMTALRLDRRVGLGAPLRPGLGFAGGTLARELKVLRHLGESSACSTPLVEGVLAANERQNSGVIRRLKKLYPSLEKLTIGVLGLTYKAGTSTLRRSHALDMVNQFIHDGALVKAYDPKADAQEVRPNDHLQFCPDPYAVATGSDALVLATEWPQFKELDFPSIRSAMRRPVILDCNNMLDAGQIVQQGFTYLGIGRGHTVGGPG